MIYRGCSVRAGASRASETERGRDKQRVSTGAARDGSPRALPLASALACRLCGERVIYTITDVIKPETPRISCVGSSGCEICHTAHTHGSYGDSVPALHRSPTYRVVIQFKKQQSHLALHRVPLLQTVQRLPCDQAASPAEPPVGQAPCSQP